jgi:hypothetical protein
VFRFSSFKNMKETYAMKYLSVISLVICIGIISSCQPDYQTLNLESQWDTLRPLENPDKGWYHHMLDNGIDKYLIQDENDLHDFPGMDHLYLRLAWAYLEPEEGKYDWSYIDDIVDKYVPLGYKISFRITSKETEFPYEKDGVGYATPYWVRQAGAKGVVPSEFGPPVWSPDWGDTIYLEKLSNFHKAFAEKYDGKPWVLYTDVGSIGDWGEGHTHFSTRIPPTVSEIKANIDIYLEHYNETQIVVTDDLIYWNKPEEEVNELLQYVLENGITFRDDSPLVDYYMSNYTDTWSVSHPQFFEAVYMERPTIYELQHYLHVKRDGNWIGKNGEEIIPEYGVSGADFFRGSMKLIRPTYIGFHGYLGEWLEDNPELTIELLNLSGYWYFPRSFVINEIKGKNLNFSIEWLNKGVAPAYSAYKLIGKVIRSDNIDEVIEFSIEDSGNMNWMPEEPVTVTYNVVLTEQPEGSHGFYIQLFDEKSGEVVEIGLQENLRDSKGFYKITEVNF